jgi:hypothetical protein
MILILSARKLLEKGIPCPAERKIYVVKVGRVITEGGRSRKLGAGTIF